MSWDVGSVLPLPYDSGSFSAVITRFTFHHFLDTEAVLNEMIRVCTKGGVVLIADPVLPSEKVDAYNHMEKLRDPSHTRALSFDQWEKLLNKSGLQNLKRTEYYVEMELEKQLKTSFPKPGDDEKIREIFKDDIGVDALGINARTVNEEIHFSYPISIYVGNK